MLKMLAAVAFALFLNLSAVQAAEVPALLEVPATLAKPEQSRLSKMRQQLQSRLAGLKGGISSFNDKCQNVVVGSADASKCQSRQGELQSQIGEYAGDAAAFNREVESAKAASRRQIKESEFFYAQQTRTLTPMNSGGQPIDTPEAASGKTHERHGLVGGTTWTFGFKWPRKQCDDKCKAEIDKKLDKQLRLYCSSQDKPEQCVKAGLPFTRENYDMVVSMAGFHTPIEDLATRVVWDGASFGEFSRQHAEIFGSLKDRHFDVLDCHSNGAMLCLAALRSGETTARKVRLFGPQINAGAAKRWRKWADKSGNLIEVYINNGDPVPAISWKQPTPQTLTGKVATAAWLATPTGGPAALADALFHTWQDSKSATMDGILRSHGLPVERFHTNAGGCGGGVFDVNCHSMRLYEKIVGISSNTP